jgi:hypothetical protein
LILLKALLTIGIYGWRWRSSDIVDIRVLLIIFNELFNCLFQRYFVVKAWWFHNWWYKLTWEGYLHLYLPTKVMPTDSIPAWKFVNMNFLYHLLSLVFKDYHLMWNDSIHGLFELFRRCTKSLRRLVKLHFATTLLNEFCLTF